MLTRRKFPILRLVFSLLALAVLGRTEQILGVDMPKLKHSFVVISHRADHVRAPENTLAAIDDAIAAEADFVEIDVRTTKDGHLVIMHDGSVDRMTDGKGKVSQMTFEEIRKLKVFNHSRPQVTAQVPTLEEVFQKTKDHVNIYLDFKQADRKIVADLIRKYGLVGQLIVYDGIDSIPKWHAVAPELPLIVTPPDNAKTPETLVDFIKKAGPDILDGDWDFYSPEMCAAAKAAGALVWPDIQGSGEGPNRWANGVKRGFTGLQTDDPERLIEWLKTQKLR
jgi:glycerophosphoryl diester phosphodiesterase